MRRALAPLALLLAPLGAAAAPSFKPAPGGSGEERAAESGSWSDILALDSEATAPWLQGLLEFLASNYGYIGVAAVLLMLFLFARGGGGDAERRAPARDDDFFEPGDADRYGDPR